MRAPWLAGVRVVLITDRRLMGGGAVVAFGDAVARAVSALPRGAALVQVREKDLDGCMLLQLVRAAMASGAPVMVNDRLDVALAAGAAGVHLPERGMSIADARRLAPDGFCIGQSRHAGVALAGDADLVQLGPIFETPGKGPAIGADAVRATRALAGRARLVAVGGISNGARAAECRAAGADAVAAIRTAWTDDVAALA